MKINKIKKNGKKYKIILDNGLEIKTFDDVIINNNLLYNKIIDVYVGTEEKNDR